MRPKSFFRQFLSVIISLGLIAQLFPRPATGQRVALAAPAEPAATSLPYDLAGELTGLGAFGPDGRPQGWLMDTGVNRAGQNDPGSLANPISISRVQSAYVPGAAISNTLIVTFTATNNQLPSQAPDIPDGATITDTIAILNAFDYTADPNTLHNVVISDVLTNNATYLGASPPPDAEGSNLLFNLGDIPPSGSVTVSLELKVPGVVAGFTPLDMGAVVYAELQGRAITASTVPAVLAPDSFGQYLQETPDADIYDEEMLKQASDLGMDPIALFEFVRAFGYESYEGSLRGTRGTLWSQAGNSLDQASLLVAMLRAGGTPARYVRGTLNTSLAQQLILSMFPKPAHVVGQIAAGAETADPANDPDLLSETQDHWWVQAYIGGVWIDLDPTFAAAQPGDAFTTVDETWAEVPDSLRHKVTLQVKVEKMEPFDVFPSDFAVTYPLSATFNSASLAGKPVMFSHFVQSSGQGGLTFVNYEHTYTPYFAIGEFEEFIQGETYQDILTNFPFGSSFATGVWLIVESRAPNGETESHERVLKDLLGPEVRQPTGVVNSSIERGEPEDPLFTELEAMVLQVVPHTRIPIQRVNQRVGRINELTPQVVDAYEALLMVEPGDQAAFTQFSEEHMPAFISAQLAGLDTIGLLFQARSTAPARNYDNERLLVKSYPARPKLILMSQTAISTTVSTSFELLNIDERALAYPGQSEDALFAANMVRTIGDKIIEYQMLEELFGGLPHSALTTFLAAIDADIEIALVTLENLAVLESLNISGEAKARITAAVLNGASVFVPQEMVEVEGEPTIGWLEVDATGHASFVSEDGRRMGATENLTLIAAILGVVAAGFGFITALIGLGTALITLMTTIATLLILIITIAGSFTPDNRALAEPVDPVIMNKVIQAVAEAEYRALAQCDAQAGAPCQQINTLADSVKIAAALAAPQTPLPASWLSADPTGEPLPIDAHVINFPATVVGANLNVNASTGMAAFNGLDDLDWSSSAAHAFSFDDLAATNTSLYASDGTLLSTGAATATSPQPAVVEGNNVMISISGSGRAGFYAAASPGLGTANNWQSYTADVTAAQPYTVTLEAATVIVGSNTYAGSLYLVVNGTTTLNGSGPAGAPNFAATAALQSQNGGLMLGPASGTFQANGQPVDVSNGVAVGGYTGLITVAEATAETDQVTFSGPADFFTLALSPATSTTDPNTAVVFDAEVEANFSAAYTITVEAPDGWLATVDSSGQTTAVPSVGATPGDYSLLVTIQSSDYPDLFASAVHTVTVTAVEGMLMAASEDGAITVPMGEILNTNSNDFLGRGIERYGQVNDGQAEVPGAAYTVVVTNTSTISHPFEIEVAGLPAGWLVLSGAEGQTDTTVALAAGETGLIGFYVAPPPPALPSPGSNYPFNVTVTATNNPSLTQSDNLVFTMPGISFPYLVAAPGVHYAEPGAAVPFDLTVTNVGDASTGGFPVTVTVQNNIYAQNGAITATLPATPATFTTPGLAVGASATQGITVDTTGATAGQSYLVAVQSAAGGYQPVTYATIQLVSPNTGAVFQAANQAATACPLNEPGLSAALETLALAMTDLELSCAAGSCFLAFRDEVVDALEGIVLYANSASPLITADSTLQTIAGDLAGHTSNGDIEADLAAIGVAAGDLEAEVCAISQHQPDARWTPTYDAGLPGQPVTYALSVENEGTVTTTYAVTVELPAGTNTFTTTLTPAATATFDYPASAVALGLYQLAAEVVAVGPGVSLSGISDSATAGLNVVDKFVQVTAVTADPAFVETGVSSTTLSVDVANVANVARPATARTTILAPGGGVSYTADLPLTVLVGSPHTYELATVNTSGWAEGVYTVTVELLDAAEALIPEGSGFGYFAVGQALGVSHAVTPTLVAPGTVTVTTIITTEILGSPIPPPDNVAPLWPPADLQVVEAEELPEESSVINSPQPEQPADNTVSPSRPPAPERPDAPPSLSPSLAVAGLTRAEQNNPGFSYVGTWTTVGSSRASGGTVSRAGNPGDTATYTFTGAWVNLGFIASPTGGQAEVFIDGASQGVIDLYRREETSLSFQYSAFVTGTHTLSVTVLGVANPNASNDYVYLDYIDVWDGTALADGTFEQNDPRVFLGTGWTNVNNPVASGGSYVHGGATAWFIFTGDSVTYQAIASTNGGQTQIYLDGRYQATLKLYSLATITRTLSFTGLVAGPHVLQISSYRGDTTVDAFITPGVPPFYTPPVPAGFTRFEEDHPALLYNGLPYTITTQSWSRSIDNLLVAGWASAGQYIGSGTAGDTVSLTFNGVWVSAGFSGESNSGLAEIFIDGVSQGVVDLYRNEADAISFSYGGLVTGTHTISITVLGSANPLASGDNVRLDYVDVWDGAALATGRVEQDDSRVLRSTGWIDVVNASASGGSYMEETVSANATAWFPFTGDSITFEALDYFRSDEVIIRIDGQFQDYYDLYTTTSPTVTYSFDNLGPGVHVLQVRRYRNEPNVDAFVTPAVGSPTPPPAPLLFTRTEEDDPAIRYNGLPYTMTASSWNRTDDASYASDGQYIISGATGDWVSFYFSGTWVQAGFLTGPQSGQVELFIDGASQGVVDLYTRDGDVTSFAFGGLPDTNHTISATILGTQHPNATGHQMIVDYFDTWDGTALPAGVYEEDHDLVWRSDNYDDWAVIVEPAASGGAYLSDDFFSNNGTVWFPFTGDSITFLGLANSSGDRIGIAIDGAWQGVFNLYSSTPISRTFSFDGLGSGPHLIVIRHYQAEPNVDAFLTPGTPPFYQTPVYTGVVRYEEDHPDLRYDGYDFVHRPQSWNSITNQPQTSGSRHVSSSTAGHAVSLTFDGRWVNAGFRARNQTGQAEIFIDGLSQGIFDLDNNASEDMASFSFGGLITGTHTISIVVVAGTVYFDYLDVWDGQVMDDDYTNVRRAEDNYRLHYSSSIVDVNNSNAHQGDYVTGSLLNVNANLWYSFVGDSFTYLAFSRQSGGSALVYVDGELVDTVSLEYDFTEQPLAFHYTGFGPGPHEVRIHNGLNFRVDAFASNPSSLAAFQPLVEWYDNSPAGNGAPFFGTVGIAAGMAAGDVTGDGTVEIVVTADDVANFGTLFVYRGDGQDTGGGDPILWSIPFGGGVFRTWLGAPALADLDGQPGSEIVVNAGDELYALYGDGTTYWVTDTVPAFEVMASPAIANLDLEPSPEIVINIGKNVYIYEHDGDKIWETTLLEEALPPVLADITGDGQLDIFLSAWDDTVYLYDYNYGSPTLEWSVTMSTTLAGMFGSAAVADIDGQQPGGDDGPEIAVSSNGRMTVLDADGSVVWSTVLDPGNPGGVSIADTDGDGEVEIVVSMRYDDGIGTGRIYTLNADGSILWETAAYDSTSANASSVLDLNGDGIYEVAWNGKEDGFTIFNGADGSVLFNEPLVYSLTGTDYPLIADVDLDGYAEVVASALGGIRVFGYDGVWGEARSLWNQYNYHITNINDDLSVPFSELNSWETHNTYRTQWPDSVALPVYDVTLTHTVGLTNVAVLTGTFSVSPTVAADPLYGWDYTQTWADTVVTRTFASELAGLRPGEARLVAEGTEVLYTLPSGTNRLVLPPLYASAAHIVTVTPLSQTVGAGGTAVYDVVLSNPAAAADSYSLTVSGQPAGWYTLPPTVTLAAGSQVTVPLAVAVPAGADLGEAPVVVTAVNGSGGTDQAGASLLVVDALDVAITPAVQTAEAGTAVTYTLTVTNHEAVAHTYDLTTSGLVDVTMPPTVTVPTGSSVALPLQAAAAANGPHPFTIQASYEGAGESDSAVLEVTGSRAVGLALAPSSAVGGPQTPVVFTVTVSNLGNITDTYGLSVSLPAGWSYEFQANGTTVNSLSLAPHVFNAADLQLMIIPAAGETPGSYNFDVSAQSQANAGISDTVSGTVQLQNRGVAISINPESSVLAPTDTGVWQVTITNTGNVADSYWLTLTGFIGLLAQLATNPVALNPGQSTTVQMTAGDLGFALPATYHFSVVAESQNNSQIRNEAIASVTFSEYEAVKVGWIPVSQTVTDTLSATFIMVVTNTGNINTTYELGLNLPAGLISQWSNNQFAIPAHIAVAVVVTVQADGPGVYLLEGTADSTSSSAFDSSTATLEVVFTNLPPSVNAGANETADEGQTIAFNGTASDPEGQPLTILWDFGDGATAGGTLTPTHAYDDDGQFTVTLVVTDITGLSASDTLQVTVDNVAPTVDAGPNQNALEGDTISLEPATFTDPGAADTHTATINWGDGTIEPGVVNQVANTVSGSHAYDDDGLYTVTVTVTDDDGDAGNDSFTVTASNAPPVVEAGNDQQVAAGTQVCLDPATFTDPGAADTHTATIDWDDGPVEPGTVNQAANTVSGCHTYTNEGSYTVTVTVTDDDGGADSDSLTVTVTVTGYSLYLPLIRRDN
ncbi:MAG: PKD domain-containing protein [Chloroflexi bacterium]|nr:PKD domain-containing protein [Chloroflexota bacterium]